MVVTYRLGTFAIALPFLFAIGALAQAAGDSDKSANDLARRVITNEAKTEAADHSHWMLRLETDKPEGKEVSEVVETAHGNLQRHLVLNGRPLTENQQREEDRRIERLVHNPAALRKSSKADSDDSEQSQKLLKMMPDAFLFTFGERRGDLVQLHFKPNPRYHAATREAQVFHAMQGDIWLSEKQSRLAQITGRLDQEVKFGRGLLGHLDSGGTFEVKQEEVAPGYWELILLNVNMKGKVLFFKTISVQQHERRSGFRKLPDDVTLAQAAEMLRKEITVAQGTASKDSR